MYDIDLPVFDLDSYIGADDSDAPGLQQQCAALAECLRETGCLVVRDPRVDARDNDKFQDLLERYFAQPEEQKRADMRPELHYQVGVTPSMTEMPRCIVVSTPAPRKLLPISLILRDALITFRILVVPNSFRDLLVLWVTHAPAHILRWALWVAPKLLSNLLNRA